MYMSINLKMKLCRENVIKIKVDTHHAHTKEISFEFHKKKGQRDGSVGQGACHTSLAN